MHVQKVKEQEKAYNKQVGVYHSFIYLFIYIYLFINPLSPNIHVQILQTDLYIIISLKNELREFDKRSKHFLLGDHFINSHYLIS